MARFVKIGTTIFIMICICCQSWGNPHPKQYEQFKALFDEETDNFISNMFSYEGLKSNIDKVKDIANVFYEYASGQRCKRGKSCKAPKSKDPVSDSHLDKIEIELKKLNSAQQGLNQSDIPNHLIPQTHENIEKYKRMLTSHLLSHSAPSKNSKRRLESTNGVDSDYIVYEGTSQNEYMVHLTSCDSDGGEMHNFNQTVYECNGVRVNIEGYNLYSTQDGYTCTQTEYVDRVGCWCKKDRIRNKCNRRATTECTFLILDPDFTKPCRQGNYDSEYFTYSNHGYDPCHWIDKDEIRTLTYTMNCTQPDYEDLSEGWGAGFINTTTPSVTYTYLIDSPEQNLVLSEFDSFTIEFRLLNFRWFSEYVGFNDTVDTLSHIYDQTNQTVTIDFGQIPDSDQKDYHVGGRVYLYVKIDSDQLEANNYGYYFELKDWSEPGTSTDYLFIIIMVLVSLLVVAFISLVTYCYIRRHYKKKEMLKIDGED